VDIHRYEFWPLAGCYHQPSKLEYSGSHASLKSCVVSIVNLTGQVLVFKQIPRLANFGTFVALASYSRQKAASKKQAFHMVKFDYGVKYAAMLQTMFSMALTIYMWYVETEFLQLFN